jgi:hypothetical protein
VTSALAEKITNPDAWLPEVVERSDIGPAHPNHPYYRAYYDEAGQPLSGERAEACFSEAQVVFEAFGFPAFVFKPEEVAA